MTTTATTTGTIAPEARRQFVAFLETGERPRGLFAPDVFCDFTMPRWRLQAEGAEAAVALRRHGHPAPGRVPRCRFDPTPTGFVLEVEEVWDADGEHWYCRELFRADVADGRHHRALGLLHRRLGRGRVAEHAAAVDADPALTAARPYDRVVSGPVGTRCQPATAGRPAPLAPSHVRAYDAARAAGRRRGDGRGGAGAAAAARRSARSPAACRRSCTRPTRWRRGRAAGPAGGRARPRLGLRRRPGAGRAVRRRRRSPRPRPRGRRPARRRPRRPAARALGPGRPAGAAAHHRAAGGHRRAPRPTSRRGCRRTCGG